MKIINSILSVLFVIFAVVQYNDPDPFLWIALYGLVAVICGLAAKGIFPKWVIRGGIAACLIGLVMLLPNFIDWINDGAESITQSMKAEKPLVETTREFLGLFSCLLVLGFQLWQSRKPK